MFPTRTGGHLHDFPWNDPSPEAQTTMADLEPLRKKLLASVAQHLTLDLFHPGKEQMLRLQIYHHLQEKLALEKVEIEDSVLDQWVEGAIAGLSEHRLTPPQRPVSAPPTHWTVDSLRSHVAPYIADHLGNALFEPGREAQLSEAVYILVLEKIRVDAISIDEALLRQLIEAISSAMGIPLPSALNQAVTPPIKTNSLPPPSKPLETQAADEHESGKKVETRPIGQTEAPRQPLTPDLRRLILLDIAPQIDPALLGTGPTETARTAIAMLVASSIQKMSVQLTEEERDSIIDTILSGEGVEFQL
ncbi:MAG: hypothetical protein SFU85_03560 [Candidatus Methylacidiphilales bacterium]|nr:hypothetical protein [Candidatus Methylacidiphilales bacterium]